MNSLEPGPTGLVSAGDVPLTRICGQRDRALAMMTKAADLIEEGHRLAHEARKIANNASGGTVFTPRDRRNESAYSNLFRAFDREASAICFRQSVDASVWLHLLDVTGMRNLMDAKAIQEFYDNLAGDVAPVNEDNVRATLESLGTDARMIFLRGLARAFTNLDRRFRSHDAFKIGARMIFTRVFDGYGGWNYYSEVRSALSDVERVFAILDGQTPEPGELQRVIDEGREGYGPRQGKAESRYFRIRTFKNGNCHLWFKRDDLVRKANLMLAEFYGEALPDGVPRDVPPEQCTALSRNLAFYPTPEPVCKELVRDCSFNGARVLEPSAGTGNIVRSIEAAAQSQATDIFRRKGEFNRPKIDAIEVHNERALICAHRTRARVAVGNFLQMRPRPVYNYVLMNPPFSGTHWIDHVIHAFEWLAPGGTLRAVLPVTAELGTSAKHERFRAWAAENRPSWDRGRAFVDLPPESFSESGTRVSTLIFSISKETR